MSVTDWGRQAELSDQALAAIDELNRARKPLTWEHELLGRLCWLAPEAVLEAVAAMRERKAAASAAACLAGVELDECQREAERLLYDIVTGPWLCKHGVDLEQHECPTCIADRRTP